MKRNKRAKRSVALVPSPRQAPQQVVFGQTPHDLARLSTETIYYRTALARRAVSDGVNAYGAELLAMSAERILAGTEAAAIAVRQIAPVQEACLEFWFRRSQALPEQLVHLLQTGCEGGRLSTECMMLWSRLANLSVAALMAHSGSHGRAVHKSARRLRAAS